MKVPIPRGVDGYRLFLKIKQLPVYSFTGSTATIRDCDYESITGVKLAGVGVKYEPSCFLFDYQRDIVKMALEKRKFAIFADCGLGKSLMFFEYSRAIVGAKGVLIVTPAMVVPQMAEEYRKFYGQEIETIPANKLQSWLNSCSGKIGVTNWEALTDELEQGQLGGLVLDESSILKSHYGAYGQAVIKLGSGLEFKLCGTGTPAPNDRIEYANHAVFLDQFPTVNAFLAKYFINRGQTNERWEIKPHALKPFYKALSDWSIFLVNPATYGWKDNTKSIPPIRVHIQDVDMTDDQNKAVQTATGGLFAVKAGGITKRSVFSRIAKGLDGSETLKYSTIKSLIESWPNESTIIWCWYNEEQKQLEDLFPDAASIKGETPMARRLELINDFKVGRRRVLISKPKVLGFGLNLQIATRQVFSSLIDSYEQYYQAVKRSNRIGSTKPLDVHIPVLDVERPMVDNVLRKASRVMKDTEEQERFFKEGL